MKSVLQKYWTKNRTAVFVSLWLAFMLCIYAPLELYMTNIGEFWFDIYVLFPICAVLFLLAMVVQLVLYAVVNAFLPRVGHVISVLHFAGTLALYVQGNYLVKNLPPLDGTDVYFWEYKADMRMSLIVWSGIFVVVCVGAWLLKGKMKSVMRYASIILVLTLAVTGLTLTLSNGGMVRKQNMISTDKAVLDMSSNQNFVILILDSVDSEVFEALLDDFPEYREAFADFTYYRDVVSIYPCTNEAIPFFYSGDVYENGEPFEDWEARCYTESPLLERLQTEGYRLGSYTEDVAASENSLIFENVGSGVERVSDYPRFAKLLMRYVGLRYAPFQCKEYFFRSINISFSELRCSPFEEADLWRFNGSNRDFLDDIQGKEVVVGEENCFRFIHVEGAHVPFHYSKDVEYIQYGTYGLSAASALTVTKEYLQKLKDAGVYDNTAIIVMADHGYDPELVHRYDPMLMVKGFGESHDLEKSMLPVSYLDLQEAYQNLLDGKTGEDVFDMITDLDRIRRCLRYEFTEEERMEEYYFHGAVWESDKWIPTGNVYIR